MAKYDLPTIVNFVLKTTGQPSLYYAAHSQGSLIAFAELSRNKDLEKKIKAVFALGPVAYLGHMKSPLKYLADFLPEVEVRNLNWICVLYVSTDFIDSSNSHEWGSA